MSSTPVPGERELLQGSTMPPPSKIARLRPNSSPEAVDMAAAAAPSPTTLGLGLALGAAPATETASGKTVFTFMQLQELEHQALIYEYIVAGIPVPLHLVFPIWKSVAAAAACDGDNHHYPSILGCGGLCLDYLRNSLEPEPGRCRRTDGKKWRCSRDVVPDQKYCDRHLHRGRSRLKKPAEATAATGVFQELMPAVRYPGPDSGGIKGQLFTAFGTGSGFN